VSETPWPNFFLIGAAKAGTTSLYHALRQHPEVFFSAIKEPGFFSGNTPVRGPDYPNREDFRITTLEEYTSLFAESDGRPVVGDASTAYLALAETAAPAIAARCPHARLAVVLRDPAERAFSHFVMHRKLQMEPEARFDAALDDETRRRAEGWGWPLCYRFASEYARQLKPYFALFPRNQILVLEYREWRDDPDAFLKRLFEFMHVDGTFRPALQKRFQSGVLPRSQRLEQLILVANPLTRPLRWILPERTRERMRRTAQAWNSRRPRMTAEERAMAIELCREDILELQDMLGWNLRVWLQ
jgi:hypothetical protein